MARFEVKTVFLLLIVSFVIGVISKSISAQPPFSHSTCLIFCFLGLFILPSVLSIHVLDSIRKSLTNSSNSVMYTLDHGRLNLELPTKSMWMNMGYWEGTNNFNSACQSLLFQVIHRAGVFGRWGTPTRADGRFVTIVDLGFGCGDQTLAIMRVPSKDTSGKVIEYLSMFDNYIGVTINRRQFECAKARFKDAGLEERGTVEVFCADAANPGLWDEDLNNVMGSLDAESKFRPDPDTGRTLKNEVWILALDCLYHFKPSRVPIFTYAAKKLEANIMAFDLILADDVSIIDHQLLKIVGRLMGCSPGAFLSKAEYGCQLNVAGYRLDHCEVHDISEHVFAPLAKFLRRREQQLNAIGLSLGNLKLAMWLFEWWARRSVVRGVVVVAKHHEREYDPP